MQLRPSPRRQPRDLCPLLQQRHVGDGPPLPVFLNLSNGEHVLVDVCQFGYCLLYVTHAACFAHLHAADAASPTSDPANKKQQKAKKQATYGKSFVTAYRESHTSTKNAPHTKSQAKKNYTRKNNPDTQGNLNATYTMANTLPGKCVIHLYEHALWLHATVGESDGNAERHSRLLWKLQSNVTVRIKGHRHPPTLRIRAFKAALVLPPE
jgi:hypothetical protein